MKLYKNIKHLETSWGQSTPQVLPRTAEDTLDSKYHDMYEEEVNPFTKFNRKNVSV